MVVVVGHDSLSSAPSVCTVSLRSGEMHGMALDKQIDITVEDTVFPSDNGERKADLTEPKAST